MEVDGCGRLRGRPRTLEPSNSSVHGRGWHEQRGDLHAIAPQASERKSLTFTVIEGEAAIDGLIVRRDALLG